MNSFKALSNNQLIEVYTKAVEENLSLDFIEIIANEMKKRGLWNNRIITNR